jgi:integrative and conjugative element protein (TIGR02256 family)
MTESRRKIFISRQAVMNIKRDCLANPATETGGVLVGRRIGGSIWVLHATQNGAADDRTPVTFVTDPEHQNRELQAARMAFPGTDFVGHWHKHPDWLGRPSDQDLAEARDVLVETASLGLSELVMPIAILDDEGVFRLYSYYFASGMNRFARVYHRLFDGDAFWEAVLSRDVDRALPYRHDFSWHETEYGGSRLQREREGLDRMGVRHEVVLLDGGALSIRAELPEGSGCSLVFLLPRDFPYGRPTVILLPEQPPEPHGRPPTHEPVSDPEAGASAAGVEGQEDGKRLENLLSIWNWNHHASLAEVYQEVLRRNRLWRRRVPSASETGSETGPSRAALQPVGQNCDTEA